jgi:molybdenum cofactor cytidylyltransferase
MRANASVAGVVLAAGTSTRMGGPNKLLFDVEGEPLVRRSVARALAAGLSPVVVVLGHEAERVRAQLEGLPCRPVINAEYAGGINASLKTGIAAVPPSVDAAVVMLADMPFVTAQMITTLVQRYGAGEARPALVISEYEGINAPPMLYDRALFAELQQMEGEGCGKQVVKRHRAEAVVVQWPAEALSDVDIPADYERMRAQLSLHAP